MKALTYLGLCLLIFISCETDDTEDISNTIDLSQEQVADLIATANWRITLYNDSGEDETSDYNGYIFNFASDGVLTASAGNDTHTGGWSITDSDDSYDDDSSDSDIDFNIGFTSSLEILEELNDDWDVISITDSKITLRDVSGGDGSVDLLTFETS